jgi:hypothetical protein
MALLVTLTSEHGRIPTQHKLDRLRLQTDILLVESVLIVIVAPLAGVALAHWRRTPARVGIVNVPCRSDRRVAWSVAMWLFAGVALFAALSATVAVAVLGAMSSSFARPVAHSHATLSAAALALGSVGVLSATAVDDPLDAVAAASACSALLGGSIFFFGPLLTDLPTPLLNIGVLVNPIVAIAAAADLDIFRMEALYRLSPLAHLRFDYPAWTTPIIFFVMLAVSSLGVAGRFNSSRDFDLSERERIAL